MSTYFAQGQQLFAEGNYREALAALRQAQQMGEPSDELFASLGHAYYQLGDLTTAVFNYSQAILHNPNEAYHLRFRGIAYLEQRQYYKALADFNAAIRLAPYDDINFWLRGHIFAALGDHKWAINSYSQAIDLNSSVSDYYADRAKAYEKVGNGRLATADREQVASLNHL